VMLCLIAFQITGTIPFFITIITMNMMISMYLFYYFMIYLLVVAYGVVILHILQIHMLHGSLPPEQQKKVFRRTVPGDSSVLLAIHPIVHSIFHPIIIYPYRYLQFN